MHADRIPNDNRELLDYIGNLADKRLEKPGNDMISKLVVEQVILIFSYFPVDCVYICISKMYRLTNPIMTA